MENSNDKTKDLEQENAHPAPNADPGAEIETVIPSAEKAEAPAESSTEPKEETPAKSSAEPKEETSAENSDKPEEESSEQDQERVGAGDNADDIEPKDKPEVPEEEKDEPEITENEGGESKTDEHGIETVSP